MMKSYWMADRRPYANGFTFLELMLVMALLSGFALTSSIPWRVFLYRATQDQIVHTQTITLFRREGDEVVLDAGIERFTDLWFNAKGNVTYAQTLRFPCNRKIVMLLGPGRFHE